MSPEEFRTLHEVKDSPAIVMRNTITHVLLDFHNTPTKPEYKLNNYGTNKSISR